MASNEEIYEQIRTMRKDFKNDLKADDKRKSLELEGSSLQKYKSVIKRIYKDLGLSEPLTPELFVKEKDKIIALLSTKPFSTRRHDYTALRVYTNDADYAQKLNEDNVSYRELTEKRERTPKQIENWITRREIYKKLDILKIQRDEAYMKLEQGENLTNSDYQAIQLYLLLLLSSDKYFPIARALDWIAFKVKNIDIEKDNYISDDKTKLVFNTYKTAKSRGQRVLDFSKYKKRNSSDFHFYSKKSADFIKQEILKWISINPTDFLFFDKNGSQLNQVNITQRLNKIFDNRKISINMLRNILLTDRQQKAIRMLQDAKAIMEGGGSSASMLNTYVKNLMLS